MNGKRRVVICIKAMVLGEGGVEKTESNSYITIS